jgi:hypothetical protein
MSERDDELLLMTTLSPATSGLPMVIWVGPSSGAPHDVRLKVMMAHGTCMNRHNLAVVALRPQPHVIAGQLSTADLRAVSQWVALNQTAMIDHWNGATDGVQFGQQLQRLQSASAPPQRPAGRTMTLHRIAAAKAYDQTGRLVVQFTDGHQPVIDLSQFLAPGEALAPLRYPERFEAVEVGADGHTVFWRLAEEVVELSADTLWLLARELGTPTGSA